MTVLVKPGWSREAPDVRRDALIAACRDSLSDDGLSGTTVRSICRRAGVSPGLLRHYFSGIGDLIAATYTDIAGRIDDVLDSAVCEAGDDPAARLIAYLTASFRAPVTDPALLGAWTCFWTLARSDDRIAAIHRDNYAGFRARLAELLVAFGLSGADAKIQAISLTALVDGLWLEMSLSPHVVTPDMARQELADWVKRLLALPSNRG